MKPEELRIGNYIKDYDCEPYFFKVEEIHRNTQGTIAVYYRNSSIMDVEPEPINLTEEWLINFGFTLPDPHYLIWYKEGFGPFRILYDVFLKHWQIGYNGGRVFKRIQYVHQLQNLYHCLTGQELTIK